MTSNKSQILSVIDQYASRFKAISSYIGANPELGNEEYLASARLKEELVFHGFTVEAPILGLETAFIGTYSAAKPGPTIALLCEYDALPEIGHACGHHLICMMSLGAAVGLKSILDEVGGTIKVFGTPLKRHVVLKYRWRKQGCSMTVMSLSWRIRIMPTKSQAAHWLLMLCNLNSMADLHMLLQARTKVLMHLMPSFKRSTESMHSGNK